jgi:hypothetical protein
LETCPNSILGNSLHPAKMEISATYCQIPESITPKPLTVRGWVNNHWKSEKVFYNFGIQCLAGFQTQPY